MKPALITKVTATEFEMDDGSVYPHPIAFEPDDVPTVEGFQEWYDKWYTVFEQQGLIPPTDEEAEGTHEA